MHIFPLNSGFISHADSSAVIHPDFVSVREITASTANTKDTSGFLFVALAALKIMFKKKNCSKWYSEAVSLTLGKPQTILRTPLITIAFYWRNNPFLRSQRGLWIIWSDANTVSVRCLDVLLGKVLSHPSRWLWRQESRRQTSQKLDKQKPNYHALWG